MAADPYKYFRVEARDLLDQLARGVLELERGAVSRELVARLLRLAHTLKGAARVVKETAIADRSHAVEGVLGPFRELGGPVPPDQTVALVGLLDDMSGRLAAIDTPERRVEGPTPLAHEETSRFLTADVDEVDALLDGIAEAGVQLASVRRSSATFERARRLAELLDEHVISPRLRSVASELREIVERADREIGTGTALMERELRQVREAAEQLRLLPARLLFGTLERVARDAAQALGKAVSFAASGGDVRFDAHVLSVVQKALVQTVRNAVAHGIEPEAERVAAGKPKAGRVALDIRRRGDRVYFACRDDGRGVDIGAVRRAAERKGVASTDMQQLGGGDLLRLLLQGGLTTAGTPTEIAGRGIGLDVVRDAAASLAGDVRVETEQGRGTTFEIVVPVSLSSLDALVVDAGGQTVAIPLEAVTQTVRLAAADVTRSADGASVVLNGRVLPFAPLARALRSTGRPSPPAFQSAVVVAGGDHACAVGVEALRGVETIVVRPIPHSAALDAVVAGASLDAEGNPRIVLDPDSLVAQTRRTQPFAPEVAPSRPPVLVIDDSLTTRMLEQSILESAGYEVDLATSAEEGLEKAARRRYALFLVDVEMPGIDGFEFIERTRKDPTLHDVPAVLVTSRSAPEDRQRGERVGAAAYIVKSEFEQTELLTRIRALVDRR